MSSAQVNTGNADSLSALSGHTDMPHFSDYKTHRTIRHTQVLEEENRKKKNPRSTTAPSPLVWGGGEVRLIVQQIW